MVFWSRSFKRKKKIDLVVKREKSNSIKRWKNKELSEIIEKK